MYRSQLATNAQVNRPVGEAPMPQNVNWDVNSGAQVGPTVSFGKKKKKIGKGKSYTEKNRVAPVPSVLVQPGALLSDDDTSLSPRALNMSQPAIDPELDDTTRAQPKDISEPALTDQGWTTFQSERRLSEGQLYRALTKMGAHKSSWWIADPRSSNMRNWDILIVVALIYTSFITPYEVAFSMDAGYADPLFVLNRIIDLTFLIDIVINFNLMYFDEPTSKWVTRRGAIAWNYLTGMAVIDIVSTIPFDFIATLAADHGGQLQNLAGLRILRVLRLTKLLRILRSSRVLKRLEDHIYFHYSYLTLAKYGASTLLLAHWMACLFHLVEESNDDPCNWVNAYFYYNTPESTRSHDICSHEHVGNLLTRYLIALYWAGMTISTVGYGDVTPQNDVERIYVIFALLVGTSFFSYIVGSVCGVLAKISEKETQFQTLMSELNSFIFGANLQPSLAARLRAYFRYQQLGANTDFTALLARMSPALRGQVAIQLHASWIEETELFSANCQRTMLIRLSFSFRQEAYPPEELLVRSGDYVSQLFVIRKGMVLIMPLDRIFHVRDKPHTIGEEMLWTRRRARYAACTITYVAMQVIDQPKLVSIMSDFSGFNNRQLRPMSIRSDMREALRMFVASVIRVRREYKRCISRGWKPQLLRLTIASQPIDVGNDATIQRHNMLTRGDSMTDGDNGAKAAHLATRRTTAKFVGSTLVETEPEDEGLDDEIEELFPMTCSMLAIAKAIPQHWARMNLAAATVQRVFRGAAARHKLRHYRNEAQRLGVKFSEVYRRAAFVKPDPNENHQVTRLERAVKAQQHHIQRLEDAVDCLSMYLFEKLGPSGGGTSPRGTVMGGVETPSTSGASPPTAGSGGFRRGAGAQWGSSADLGGASGVSYQFSAVPPWLPPPINGDPSKAARRGWNPALRGTMNAGAMAAAAAAAAAAGGGAPLASASGFEPRAISSMREMAQSRPRFSFRMVAPPPPMMSRARSPEPIAEGGGSERASAAEATAGRDANGNPPHFRSGTHVAAKGPPGKRTSDRGSYRDPAASSSTRHDPFSTAGSSGQPAPWQSPGRFNLGGNGTGSLQRQGGGANGDQQHAGNGNGKAPVPPQGPPLEGGGPRTSRERFGSSRDPQASSSLARATGTDEDMAPLPQRVSLDTALAPARLHFGGEGSGGGGGDGQAPSSPGAARPVSALSGGTGTSGRTRARSGVSFADDGLRSESGANAPAAI